MVLSLLYPKISSVTPLFPRPRSRDLGQRSLWKMRVNDEVGSETLEVDIRKRGTFPAEYSRDREVDVWQPGRWEDAVATLGYCCAPIRSQFPAI